MLFKKGHKLCFGLLLLLFIIFGFSLNVYSDASAVALPYSQFGAYTGDYGACSTFIYNEGYAFNEQFQACSMRAVLLQTVNIGASGGYWSTSGKVNVVIRVGRHSGYPSIPDDYKFVNRETIQVMSASHSGVPLTISNSSVQTYVTYWTGDYNVTYATLTIQYSASGQGATNSSGPFRILIGSPEYAFIWPSNNSNLNATYMYFENSGQTPDVNFAGSFNDGSSQTIINQNNTQITQNDQIITQNQQYYDHEYEAESNISGQSASDIPDSTSPQTTSIIGVISSFITALGTVQTGSCELTLPFPNFVGGSQVVNPCTGKEKAPAIVQIGSSMLLIGTFIPLAFIVLKMIYNEIRSWTNG